MAKHTIPAQSFITCDACNKRCGEGADSNRSRRGGLMVTADALDLTGHAVGNGNKTFDLCDSCLGRFERLIVAEMQKIAVEAERVLATQASKA